MIQSLVIPLVRGQMNAGSQRMAGATALHHAEVATAPVERRRHNRRSCGDRSASYKKTHF